jgi:serine O-acetyltransferase
MRPIGSTARADIERYLPGPATFSASLVAIVNYYGLQASLTYRFGRALLARRHAVWLWPVALPGWILYWLAACLMRYGYGIRLDLSARIGPGLYVGHIGGIELMNCSLGEHCSIGEQTKIGCTTKGTGPTLGKRVWVGGHARVRGDISVGDGATIGAGALITSDVPARCLILGSPARIVSRDYDNSAIL